MIEGCVNQEYVVEFKVWLENGMCGKVKFIGEVE